MYLKSPKTIKSLFHEQGLYCFLHINSKDYQSQ